MTTQLLPNRLLSAIGTVLVLFPLSSAALFGQPGSHVPAPASRAAGTVAAHSTSVTIRPASDAAAAALGVEAVPVTVRDAMGHAAVGRLPASLYVGGIPVAHEYRAGDVGYQPETRTVLIFLTSGAGVPDKGFVRLGRVTDGMDPLHQIVGAVDIVLSAEPPDDLPAG
jgi:hypothetical protein